MSDAFQRGLERAFARKKNNVNASIKSVSVKPIAKVATGFDEVLYQVTIINKMIKLIRKTKEQKQ